MEVGDNSICCQFNVCESFAILFIINLMQRLKQDILTLTLIPSDQILLVFWMLSLLTLGKGGSTMVFPLDPSRMMTLSQPASLESNFGSGWQSGKRPYNSDGSNSSRYGWLQAIVTPQFRSRGELSLSKTT